MCLMIFIEVQNRVFNLRGQRRGHQVVQSQNADCVFFSLMNWSVNSGFWVKPTLTLLSRQLWDREEAAVADAMRPRQQTKMMLVSKK